MAEDKKAAKKRPTAEKRELQNKKARLINKSFKSRVRTTMRRFDESCAKKDEAAIKIALNDVYSMLDRAAKRGVFKINKANRSKARASARAVAVIG